MRYLDPKNDLVFKRIFGEHANILISFLNALLPLEPSQKIVSITYLPSEMVPELPVVKNSIVDVRCVDNFERHFIVEMQMIWSDSFKYRVLFNASKAFVRQLDRGKNYIGLKAVYALSIVNEIFEPKSNHWYHHYKMTNLADSTISIDGLQLIFVELPKFKTKIFKDKKLSILWLRFMSEVEKNKEMMDEELLKELMAVPEIAQALELTKESAYTKAELEAYDKYWDSISVEKTLIADAENRGLLKGRQIGEERGNLNKAKETAINLKELGKLTIEEIAEVTGLDEQMIQDL